MYSTACQMFEQLESTKRNAEHTASIDAVSIDAWIDSTPKIDFVHIGSEHMQSNWSCMFITQCIHQQIPKHSVHIWSFCTCTEQEAEKAIQGC